MRLVFTDKVGSLVDNKSNKRKKRKLRLNKQKNPTKFVGTMIDELTYYSDEEQE